MSILKTLRPNPYDAEKEMVIEKLNEHGYDKVRNWADKNLYPHTWTVTIYEWLANQEKEQKENEYSDKKSQ